MPDATRWGIASTGNIAHDFATALSSLPAEEHKLVAVGARSVESAQQFASKYGLPSTATHGSYQSLCSDPSIDVVYVATIHPTHKDVCRLAINAGKAVLVEKPLAMNAAETEEIVRLARSKGVFLMEAIWSRFHPLYELIQEALKSGQIGRPLRVHAAFGSGSKRPRVWERALGGSAMLDIGIYCVQLATLVFGHEPTEVIGTGCTSDQEDPVDISVSSVLTYPEGQYAMISTDLRTPLANEAYIFGTEGKIKICSPFHCPLKVEINNKVHEVAVETEGYKFVNSFFLRNEAMAVRDSLLKGMTECPKMPLDESIGIARLMERMRKQAGARTDWP